MGTEQCRQTVGQDRQARSLRGTGMGWLKSRSEERAVLSEITLADGSEQGGPAGPRQGVWIFLNPKGESH